MITTKPINDRNREVYADGEHIGWVTYQSLGRDIGWSFTAAHKRLTNRYPDGPTVATWQEALPR